MNGRIVANFVIAVATTVGWSLRDAHQEARPVTDPASYALYAAVLPALWDSVSRDPIVLQQETEDIAAISGCLSPSPATANRNWDLVEAQFKQVNARAGL